MLRLTSIFVRSYKARISLSKNVIQSTTVNNQRWLAQQIQELSHPKLRNVDEKNKITPMGWFLLLIPVTTFGLGCWQVKRKGWKEKLIQELEYKTKLTPVDFPDNLDDLKSMEFQAVKLKGHFLHEKELYIGPRSLIRPDGGETQGGLFSQRDGSNGYLVITPFKLSDRDTTVLINRGWVARQSVKPESRPKGQIQGETELTAIVRMGEKRPQFTPDHKGDVSLYLYRDLDKMCKKTGADPIFLDAKYNSSTTEGPIGGQTRVTLRNDHLSYLITWFSLSAATSMLWYRQIIKRKAF